MRKVGTALIALILAIGLIPNVLSVDTGTGIGVGVETEKFSPLVWMCDQRIVYDDNVEPGRIDFCEHKDHPEHSFIGDGFKEEECKDVLIERIENYAFEGEQIHWKILVMDKNGVEKIKDVFMTIGSSQGAGNDIEANCMLDTEPRLDCCEGNYCHEEKDCLEQNKYALELKPVEKWWKGPGCYERHDGRPSLATVPVEKVPVYLGQPECIPDTCNARILEEEIDEFDSTMMAFYDCLFTVETPNSMVGEYFITVEALDLDDLSGTMDENEYWFLNPEIGLSIDGTISFGQVRPGTEAYSDTLLVGNDAEAGSGVLLDMFIAGTDFYDPASSGAKCPTTNQLALTNFAYFATNGAYSTQDFALGPDFCIDDEGYSTIPYGDRITQAKEIIGCKEYNHGFYQPGNVLTPGAEMAITFRLALPEPCNGDFSEGSIFFWGEAV